MKKTVIVAEIGINHNGDLRLARRMISAAKKAGCDFVKFQKKTVDIVYSSEKLNKRMKSPFGKTFRDLKYGLEFSRHEYEQIDSYCKEQKIPWFASCWDKASVDFILQFSPPLFKIPSNRLCDDGLISFTAEKNIPLILSCGGVTDAQISHALEVVDSRCVKSLMYCVPSYPANPNDVDLFRIMQMEKKFRLPVGYSNHSPVIYFCVAAVALGAPFIEFHLALDRKMWGKDQSSSLEPHEVNQLVRMIRVVEKTCSCPRRFGGRA
jgi:N-acetylneuraminate synthase